MAEPHLPRSRTTSAFFSARHWLGALMLALAAGSVWLLLFHTPDPYRDKTMLRNHIPPLFHPHRTSFECRHEAQAVPPIDPQADAWLQHALDLESRDIPMAERNWQRIVELTQAAAAKQHWQAMLNLVNLRLEGRGEPYGLPRNSEAAVREVEAAMALGIPAAFDMMGSFYERGIGVDPDISVAYAFYQHAAELGHPPALTFLAEKMLLVRPNPDLPGRYANRPVGLKMLECAFAQGYGPSAYRLSMEQVFEGNYTPEAKAQALRTLHEGVKMGDKNCASKLEGQFRGFMFGDAGYLPPHGIDKARSERYYVIARKLDWYGPRLKLPNLDAVLPLPPAKLPPWDGDRDTLTDAAKGLIPVKPPRKPVQHSGRAFIPEGHAIVMPSRPDWDAAREQSAAWTLEIRQTVTQSGYWQPQLQLPPGHTQADWRLAQQINSTPPQRYARGERLETLAQWGELTQMQRYQYLRWHFKGQAVAQATQPLPRVQAGLALRHEMDGYTDACPPGGSCPTTGVWRAFVPTEHPQAALFNVWWRQAFFTQGQTLPGPEHWGLAAAGVNMAAADIKWWLLKAGA